MALTVESLKGLYEKLGGTDFVDVSTIPEAIDKITEVAESGGGGEEDFTVTATLGKNGDNLTITDLSKSVGEINAAYSAGKRVHLVIDGSIFMNGMDFDIPLTQIAGSNVAFFGGNISGEGMATGLALVRWDGDDAEVSMYVPQGSAGSNDYKVIFKQDEQNVITTDGKSIADIRAAAIADKNVYGVMAKGNGSIKLPLTFDAEGMVQFGGVIMDFDGSTWTPKAVGLIGQVLNDQDDWALA